MGKSKSRNRIITSIEKNALLWGNYLESPQITDVAGQLKGISCVLSD